MKKAGKFSSYIIQRSKDLKIIDYSNLITLEIISQNVRPELVSEYSSLNPRDYIQVIRVFKAELPSSDGTIIDGTAHIGIDSINFSYLYGKINDQRYGKVISVEIDKFTSDILYTNMKRFFKERMAANVQQTIQVWNISMAIMFSFLMRMT